MSELKPCPFCGSDAREEYGLVWCTNLSCGMSVTSVYPDTWNRRASAWRTIDSAPRDGTEVLVYHRREGGDTSKVFIASYTDYTIHYTDGGEERIEGWQPTEEGWDLIHPTHWMPRPDEPGEEE